MLLCHPIIEVSFVSGVQVQKEFVVSSILLMGALALSCSEENTVPRGVSLSTSPSKSQKTPPTSKADLKLRKLFNEWLLAKNENREDSSNRFIDLSETTRSRDVIDADIVNEIKSYCESMSTDVDKLRCLTALKSEVSSAPIWADTAKKAREDLWLNAKKVARKNPHGFARDASFLLNQGLDISPPETTSKNEVRSVITSIKSHIDRVRRDHKTQNMNARLNARIQFLYGAELLANLDSDRYSNYLAEAQRVGRYSDSLNPQRRWSGASGIFLSVYFVKYPNRIRYSRPSGRRIFLQVCFSVKNESGMTHHLNPHHFTLLEKQTKLVSPHSTASYGLSNPIDAVDMPNDSVAGGCIVFEVSNIRQEYILIMRNRSGAEIRKPFRDVHFEDWVL